MENPLSTHILDDLWGQDILRNPHWTHAKNSLPNLDHTMKLTQTGGKTYGEYLDSGIK